MNILEQFAKLEAENTSLRHDITTLENMMAYEKNKYERLLSSQRSALVEDLLSFIGLELQAIHDIAEHVPEDDKRRIMRRLHRITGYLAIFAES